MFVTAGVCLNTLETNTAVRSCGFSFSANLIMLTTDKTMGFPCDILVYDVRDGSQISQFFSFYFFYLCSQLLIVLSYFKACCLLAGEVLHAVLLLHFRLWYRLDGTFQTFGLKLVKVPQLTSLVTSWLASAMFVMKQRFSGPSKKNGDVVKLNNTG